jgi:hypothetical protein
VQVYGPLLQRTLLEILSGIWVQFTQPVNYFPITSHEIGWRMIVINGYLERDVGVELEQHEVVTEDASGWQVHEAVCL